MSYLVFQDADESVHLWGGEFMHCRQFPLHLALTVLRPHLKVRYRSGPGYMRPRIAERIETGSYLDRAWDTFYELAYDYTPGQARPPSVGHATFYRQEHVYESTLETYLAVDGDVLVNVAGKRVTESFLHIALNTGLAFSDETALMARLIGCGEAHLFVRGPNRSWLADLIEQGRKRSIFRDLDRIFKTDVGSWESVISFLRLSDEKTVVTSYSGTDSFPSTEYLGYEWNDEDEDDTAEVRGRRWQWGLDALEERERDLAAKYDTWTYELKPDGFRDVRFSYAVSAFDLNEELASEAWDEEQEAEAQRAAARARP